MVSVKAAFVLLCLDYFSAVLGVRLVVLLVVQVSAGLLGVRLAFVLVLHLVHHGALLFPAVVAYRLPVVGGGVLRFVHGWWGPVGVSNCLSIHDLWGLADVLAFASCGG